MSRFTFTALFSLITSFGVNGGTPLSELARNYTQMRDVNISYEALISSELTLYAIQDFAKAGQIVEPKWQTRISFNADQRGFYLGKSRLGKNASLNSFSYDGTIYATFGGGPDQILQISRRSGKVPPTVWNSDPLVLPAAMLAQSHNSHGQIDCLWREVIDPDFWKASSALLPNGRRQLSGVVDKNIITWQISGEDNTGDISDWESHQGTSEKPWMKYACLETGEVSFQKSGQGRIFVFPKKAVFQMFYGSGDLPGRTRSKLKSLVSIIRDSTSQGFPSILPPSSIPTTWTLKRGSRLLNRRA